MFTTKMPIKKKIQNSNICITCNLHKNKRTFLSMKCPIFTRIIIIALDKHLSITYICLSPYTYDYDSKYS